jgi:hypothetical protein
MCLYNSYLAAYIMSDIQNLMVTCLSPLRPLIKRTKSQGVFSYGAGYVGTTPYMYHWVNAYLQVSGCPLQLASTTRSSFSSECRYCTVYFLSSCNNVLCSLGTTLFKLHTYTEVCCIPGVLSIRACLITLLLASHTCTIPTM